MRIYLMQHGVSLPEELDPGQGISPVGREEVELCARAASRMGITFTDIFCSPKKRSRQTAQIMALGCGFPEDDIEISDDCKPMADPDRTLRTLYESGCGASVLLCGHLPHLNRLACRLLTSGPEFELAIENAALLCLSMNRLPTQSARLEWYLRPEHLAELAGPAPRS